jgi:mRNA interferase YafQ
MKYLKPTTQFKKDLKKIRHNPNKANALKDILYLLEHEIPIPDKFKPHKLIGNYKDCMECHIEGDFLLIWFDPETNDIDLVRLGSHSELFGKANR